MYVYSREPLAIKLHNSNLPITDEYPDVRIRRNKMRSKNFQQKTQQLLQNSFRLNISNSHSIPILRKTKRRVDDDNDDDEEILVINLGKDRDYLKKGTTKTSSNDETNEVMEVLVFPEDNDSNEYDITNNKRTSSGLSEEKESRKLLEGDENNFFEVFYDYLTTENNHDGCKEPEERDDYYENCFHDNYFELIKKIETKNKSEADKNKKTKGNQTKTNQLYNTLLKDFIVSELIKKMTKKENLELNNEDELIKLFKPQTKLVNTTAGKNSFESRQIKTKKAKCKQQCDITPESKSIDLKNMDYIRRKLMTILKSKMSIDEMTDGTGRPTAGSVDSAKSELRGTLSCEPTSSPCTSPGEYLKTNSAHNFESATLSGVPPKPTEVTSSQEDTAVMIQRNLNNKLKHLKSNYDGFNNFITTVKPTLSKNGLTKKAKKTTPSRRYELKPGLNNKQIINNFTQSPKDSSIKIENTTESEENGVQLKQMNTERLNSYQSPSEITQIPQIPMLLYIPPMIPNKGIRNGHIYDFPITNGFNGTRPLEQKLIPSSDIVQSPCPIHKEICTTPCNMNADIIVFNVCIASSTRKPSQKKTKITAIEGPPKRPKQANVSRWLKRPFYRTKSQKNNITMRTFMAPQEYIVHDPLRIYGDKTVVRAPQIGTVQRGRHKFFVPQSHLLGRPCAGYFQREDNLIQNARTSGKVSYGQWVVGSDALPDGLYSCDELHLDSGLTSLSKPPDWKYLSLFPGMARKKNNENKRGTNKLFDGEGQRFFTSKREAKEQQNNITTEIFKRGEILR